MSEFLDHIEVIKKGRPPEEKDYSFDKESNTRQRRAFDASVSALAKAVDRGPLAEAAADAMRDVVAEQARHIAHLEADVVRLTEQKLLFPPTAEE